MFSNLDEFSTIILSCKNSTVGKLLPSALYVHTCSLKELDPTLQNYESHARVAVKEAQEATLVKFSTDKPKISYLFYPNFDRDPHPKLQGSIIVDLQTLEVNYRDYSSSENPPILHRKETFVTRDYPFYQEFAELTYFESALGLLDNARFIGTYQEWQKRLTQQNIAFEGHRLICTLDPDSDNQRVIPVKRHKAAIFRRDISRPVKVALEANLFTPQTTFFDYGCGYGKDVEYLTQQGYTSSGWDPFYRPDSRCIKADIVNLGYIINVIEDLKERRETLIKAWELTRQVLIVAAQVLIDDRKRGLVAYGDGIITNRNTFQKYFEQEELKTYIDQVLNVDAIPVGLGIYFVFRDEAIGQTFRASRFRSSATTPRIRAKVKHFEDYEELLAPLMAFVTHRGRLPGKGELPEEAEIKAEFHSLRSAFKLIVQATDESEWEAIAQKRQQDLSVYLALTNFSRRPKFKEFNPEVREDIKAFFGNYKKACLMANMMLFSLSDLDNIASLCSTSPVGKKRENSLLVHISALEKLDPLLRLYEGCASRTIGRLEDANLIKLNTHKPKIAYLFYPDFDKDPHPVLKTSMEIDLRDLQVRFRNYNRDSNPPILLEKDTVVAPDYPLYRKFARLTRQEQNWGLLDNYNLITHRQVWLECLEEHCAIIRGHQLCWRKDADPYKVKLLRAQINNRKRQKTIEK